MLPKKMQEKPTGVKKRPFSYRTFSDLQILKVIAWVVRSRLRWEREHATEGFCEIIANFFIYPPVWTHKNSPVQKINKKAFWCYRPVKPLQIS